MGGAAGSVRSTASQSNAASSARIGPLPPTPGSAELAGALAAEVIRVSFRAACRPDVALELPVEMRLEFLRQYPGLRRLFVSLLGTNPSLEAEAHFWLSAVRSKSLQHYPDDPRTADDEADASVGFDWLAWDAEWRRHRGARAASDEDDAEGGDLDEPRCAM